MFKGLVRTLLVASLIPLFSSLFSGCGPFWVDPYITVRESQLNWVHIHYYNMRHKPIRRVSLYINGTGMVEIRKGTSELVSNDFAKRYESADWAGIKTGRVQITPQQATDIFQNLVNEGLLDREKTFKASKKDSPDRFIAVKANIDSHTYSDNVNMFEEDPDLAEHLLDVVREFEQPSR